MIIIENIYEELRERVGITNSVKKHLDNARMIQEMYYSDIVNEYGAEDCYKDDLIDAYGSEMENYYGEINLTENDIID